MVIIVFNTLTNKKERLRKSLLKPIRLFVCGQTVYDHAHLGHARTYVVFDVIVRYLRYSGFKIKYIQNITDIDDKIIERSKERKQHFKELAQFFANAYLEDMKKLHVENVDMYPRASDFMDEIQTQINILLNKGYAYKTSSGIYFEVRKFKKYGELSRQKLDELRHGYRIEPDPEKHDPLDFALWKFKEEPPFWQSPWGNGRPGWHIEDTAITNSTFGAQYEIHGGANELKFPHHEAEIAQQESASGKSPLVKTWIHTGLLLVNGEKMSKSLGNFVTIRDFLAQWSPNILRWIIMSHHYRSPINYTEELAEDAYKSLIRFYYFLDKLDMQREKGLVRVDIKRSIKEADKEFSSSMNDDFNTERALASLFSFLSSTEPRISDMHEEEALLVKNYIISTLKLLGIEFERAPIPSPVLRLLNERESLRKEKKFEEADKVRIEVQKLGYDIEDTARGPHAKALHPRV